MNGEPQYCQRVQRIIAFCELLTLPDGLLGAACGREGRMIAAVCDAGFASRLQMLMTEAE